VCVLMRDNEAHQNTEKHSMELVVVFGRCLDAGSSGYR
jgi:hypothetical protein